ncbi:ABC transporter permease subunit, partial [uncultured Dubosiella sp.]
VKSGMESLDPDFPIICYAYREGAFGLGAGKWHVIRTVVLPSSIEGILAGCILSIGRILSESAALLFTAGFAHEIYGFFAGLQNSGSTLTVALYVYAKEQGEFEAAFAIAAILMLMVLLLQIIPGFLHRALKARDR